MNLNKIASAMPGHVSLMRNCILNIFLKSFCGLISFCWYLTNFWNKLIVFILLNWHSFGKTRNNAIECGPVKSPRKLDQVRYNLHHSWACSIATDAILPTSITCGILHVKSDHNIPLQIQHLWIECRRCTRWPSNIRATIPPLPSTFMHAFLMLSSHECKHASGC